MDMVRALADDIGMALSSITIIPVIRSLYEQLERLSGLALKLKKCIIIPVAKKVNDELIHVIRTHLTRLAPSWLSMAIRGWAKYLGFAVGPEGYDKVQKILMCKYVERNSYCRKFVLARVLRFACIIRGPCQSGSLFYNCLILSLTLRKERLWLSRLCHGPPHFLPLNLVYQTKQAGTKVEFRSIAATAVASQIRTAKKTLAGLRQPVKQCLDEHREVLLPVSSQLPMHYGSALWDFPAFVDVLSMTTSGVLPSQYQ